MYRLQSVERHWSLSQWIKSLAVMMAVIFAAFSNLAFAQTQEEVDGTLTEEAPVLPSLSTNYPDDSFEAYIDGVVDEAMTQGHAAGLTLSVVRGDAIRVLKGYGYVDVENQVSVDPSVHTFRIGSVGKTFTYILAMQLVEEGKLDLEADVNTYLTEFKIPDTYETPVKIKDLMSHRSGFDVVLNNLFVETPEDFMSLEAWLKGNIPARVRAPGKVTNYDNYGVALLGYITQEVSGKLYEDLLDEKILQPLKMTKSTAKQKLNEGDVRNMSAEIAADTATPYFWRNGNFVSTPFELVPASPAGAMSSTAADMARYMLANLNDLSLEGARLLSPEGAVNIRERLYPGRPGADFAHGFRNGKFEGFQTYEHSGATQASFTMMILIPELDIGVYASTNGTDGSQVQAQVVNRILKKMIGSDAAPRTERLDLEEASPYVGDYIGTRRSFKNAMKIASLGGGTATVSETDRGTLRLSAGGQASEYERIGEHVFQKLESDDVIAFEVDDSGTATRFHVPYGHMAMERVPADVNANGFFLIAGLAFLLSMTQIISAWKRRSDPTTPKTRWSLGLSILLLIAACLVILTLAFVGLTLTQMDSLGNRFIFEWPISNLIILNWIILFLVGATLFVVLGLYPMIAKSKFSIWRKIHYVLFAVVLVLLVLKLNDWNLLGFKY